MLFRGTLVRPIDWLDLALHGAPWLARDPEGSVRAEALTAQRL